MNRTIFIYALRDPRTNAVRYVGQTIDPKVRYRHHLGGGTKSTRAWIVELRRAKLVPALEIVQTLRNPTREEAADAEYEYLVHFPEGALLNVRDSWSACFAGREEYSERAKAAEHQQQIEAATRRACLEFALAQAEQGFNARHPKG